MDHQVDSRNLIKRCLGLVICSLVTTIGIAGDERTTAWEREVSSETGETPEIGLPPGFEDLSYLQPTDMSGVPEIGPPPEAVGQDAPAGSAYIWGVGFQSQLRTGCNYGNYCCGLAATNMATAFQYRVNPTPEYLKKMYQYLNLNSCCNSGTTIPQDVAAAKAVGNCPSTYGGPLSYADMKTWVSWTYPVLAALKYSYITNKCSWYTGYHALLVVGYDDAKAVWYVHDPLCNWSNTGAYRQIPYSEFKKGVDAFACASGWCNGNTAMVVIARR